MRPSVARGASWVGMGLLGVLALLVSACTELPVASEDGVTHLRVELEGPPLILLATGDSSPIVARVFDEAGNRVVPPLLRWKFPEYGRPIAALGDPFANRFQDTIWVVGTSPENYTVSAWVDAGERFSSDTAEVGGAVRYGTLDVEFRDAPGDTLLTTRREMRVYVDAFTEQGALVPHGQVFLETRTGILEQTDRYAPHRMWAFTPREPGVDTLVAWHSECATCRDVLVVRFDPVPAQLVAPPPGLGTYALADTFQLEAFYADSLGHPIEPAPAVWSMLDPADTVHLELLDPASGTVVSKADGTVWMHAQTAGLDGDLRVWIHQRPLTYEIVGLPAFSAPLGVRDSVYVHAVDANGHPFLFRSGGWWTATDPGVVAIDEALGSPMAWEAVGFGESTVTLNLSVCEVYPDCQNAEQSRNVTVIPEPDSVRITGVDPDPISGPGDEVAVVKADIFLPGTTYRGVDPAWRSLDPGIATVDDLGRITSHAPGEVRIEARVGASVDTVTVTVGGG